MELVTFLEAFIGDCDVCIYDYTVTKGKFVVYKGNIRQFLTNGEEDNSPCLVYGDYLVHFINIDKETGRLVVGI